MVIFHLKSSHRLKSISGTIIIIVDNNNFDFIAILLLEPQPSESRFQLIFIGSLRGLQVSLAIILKIKDK